MATAFNPEVLDKIRYEQRIKSDRALGEKLGVSRKTINNWRSGRTEPRISHLSAMASFGIPLQEMVKPASSDSSAEQYAA